MGLVESASTARTSFSMAQHTVTCLYRHVRCLQRHVAYLAPSCLTSSCLNLMHAATSAYCAGVAFFYGVREGLRVAGRENTCMWHAVPGAIPAPAVCAVAMPLRMKLAFPAAIGDDNPCALCRSGCAERPERSGCPDFCLADRLL